MIIFGNTREVWRLLPLIKNFTDENSVDPYASFATEVHDAWVCVTFFEEEVLVKLVYEVNFYGFHSLFDALEDEMMPVWGQSQEFSEICHVEFQQGHDNSRV